MIAGIGTDIVAIARMTEIWRLHGERAMSRILALSELESCRAAAEPGRFLAKRFAAKEALGKGLGTGVRAPVLLASIAVGHDASGKPVFEFAPALADYLADRGLRTHLSISDERDFAVAFVVVEQCP